MKRKPSSPSLPPMPKRRWRARRRAGKTRSSDGGPPTKNRPSPARPPARVAAPARPPARASIKQAPPAPAAQKPTAADVNLFQTELIVPPKETLERFLNCLRAGMLHADALMATGLVWRTVSNMLWYDKQFSADYTKAKAEGNLVDKMRVADENLKQALEGVTEKTTVVDPDGGITQRVRIRPSDPALRRELHRTAPGVYMPLPAGVAGGQDSGASEWDAAIAEAERRRAAEAQAKAAMEQGGSGPAAAKLCSAGAATVGKPAGEQGGGDADWEAALAECERRRAAEEGGADRAASGTAGGKGTATENRGRGELTNGCG